MKYQIVTESRPDEPVEVDGDGIEIDDNKITIRKYGAVVYYTNNAESVIVSHSPEELARLSPTQTTSGTLDTSRIPNLDASKITSAVPMRTLP